MDTISIKLRSYTMSRIRAKDTKPELLIRKALFKIGYRYRVHVKNLPGKPDMVLRKYNTIIFIHGCFWHLHKNCRDGRLPKSKLEYWKPKLERNVIRDKINQRLLKKSGWQLIILWECEILNNIDKTIAKIERRLMRSRMIDEK